LKGKHLAPSERSLWRLIARNAEEEISKEQYDGNAHPLIGSTPVILYPEQHDHAQDRHEPKP
jgi:hypothetical protein